MPDGEEGAVDVATRRLMEFLREHGVELGSNVEGTTNRITVVRMATERCMLDAIKASSPEANYQASLARARDRQLEHLWLRDRLDTPWALLVDQEFSGPPVTVDQFEEFSGRAGDRVLESFRLQEEYEALVYELLRMVTEAGYVLAGEDLRHLYLIATSIKLMDQFDFASGMREQTRRSVEQDIAAMTDPDHPVWWALLGLYFPEDESA